jgi:ferredoxin-NADP reductase
MKNLKLEVHDDQGKLVRTYSFTFDETEGQNYSITVDKTTHNIDAEGNILPTINPNFTPYD